MPRHEVQQIGQKHPKPPAAATAAFACCDPDPNNDDIIMLTAAHDALIHPTVLKKFIDAGMNLNQKQPGCHATLLHMTTGAIYHK